MLFNKNATKLNTRYLKITIFYIWNPNSSGFWTPRSRSGFQTLLWSQESKTWTIKLDHFIWNDLFLIYKMVLSSREVGWAQQQSLDCGQFSRNLGAKLHPVFGHPGFWTSRFQTSTVIDPLTVLNRVSSTVGIKQRQRTGIFKGYAIRRMLSKKCFS